MAKMLLPNGQTDYISNRYIYTRFARRIILQKFDDKWQIAAFIALTSRFSKIGKHFSSNNLAICAVIVENQVKNNRLW